MSLPTKTTQTESPWLPFVQAQVESLRFGVVQIVVHDSQVIQIERTEKLRLDKITAPEFAPAAKPRLSQMIA